MGVADNVKFVNNTCLDLRLVWSAFEEAYVTGSLCECLSDMFEVTILKGVNSDGSDRLIINNATE